MAKGKGSKLTKEQMSELARGLVRMGETKIRSVGTSGIQGTGDGYEGYGVGGETPKTKTKPKVTTTTKKSVTSMQNGIGATDKANFEAARKKLRGNSSSSSSMDSSAASAANTNTNLMGGSRDSVEGLTRQQARKNKRKNKRARRRADRGDAQDGSGNATQQAQYDVNLQAEKNLIEKRRAGRKQYLRNFGSQLVKGVNADTPGSATEIKNVLANTGKAETEPPKSELELNAKANRRSIDGTFGQMSDKENGNMKGLLFGGANSFTANTSSEDSFKDDESTYDDLSKKGRDAMGIGNKLSPIDKAEPKDSNPKSFMQEEFMKKLGYK